MKKENFLIAIFYVYHLLSVILNISLYLHCDISKLLFNIVAGQIHLHRIKTTWKGLFLTALIFPRLSFAKSRLKISMEQKRNCIISKCVYTHIVSSPIWIERNSRLGDKSYNSTVSRMVTRHSLIKEATSVISIFRRLYSFIAYVAHGVRG